MGLSFLATSPDELAELAKFLTEAFGLPAEAPFAGRRLLEWKCFAPHPYWQGARSYVLRDGARYAAHGCAHPASFLTAAGEVRATRVIDWAGSAAVPGAGVLLFRKFAGLAQVLLAVGGSEDTRSILPKIGFRQAGEMSLYARPVRVWRQFAKRGSPGRLVRNAVWSWAPPARVPAGVEAVRVEKFERVPAPAASAEMTPVRRGADVLNYMLACPGAAFSGYVIRERGAVCGYFVLSRVGGQARVADLWTEEDWDAAYTLAVRAAMRDPETCEVAAAASVDRLRRAAAGVFQPRGTEPVFVYDPKGMLAGAPPLHVQLLDGDECYLNNPRYEFWT